MSVEPEAFSNSSFHFKAKRSSSVFQATYSVVEENCRKLIRGKSGKQMTNKMSSEEPANEQELLPVEESLMSLEKLDRASPDLWPEQTNDQVPGVNEYVAQNSPQTEPPTWAASLTADDINKLHQLGNLSMTGLIAEVKKLHDMAYQLGLEEAKEMTRGKYLNIFKHK